MALTRLAFAVFASSLVVSLAPNSTLTAQPSVTPGPPPAPTPVVVDSAGQEVGRANGTGVSTQFRYVLAADDWVVLIAQSTHIRSVNPTNLNAAWVYFLDSPVCTGAEVFADALAFGPAVQLTRRQALVINRPFIPPVLFGPIMTASDLYVTEPFPSSQFRAGPFTGASRFNLITLVCEVPSIWPGGMELLRFQKREDLLARFTPPFWVAFRP